ncbi:MAG: hypothetical protein ACREJ0_20135 [Geminicoccaceae bacterium]
MLAISKQYAEYRSAYLAGGYHEDAASLDDVQITRTSIRGSFRMTRRFAEPDGHFELSAHNVMLWALQLGVIFGCAQHGCSKERNLSLREVSLKCLRPVTDPTQISVRLRLRFRRPVPGGMYYVGDIDVDHGGFAGRIGFTFPTE